MTRPRMIPALLFLATMAAWPIEPSAQPPSPIVAKPGTVTLVVSPADAHITLDGRAISPGTPLTLPPGTHAFEVRRQGYTPRVETVLIGQGNPSIILSVNLSRASPAGASGRSGGLVDRLEEAAVPPIGWAGLGVGTGLIATSIVLAARSGVPDSCAPPRPTGCDEARDLAGWATFTAATGGALAAGGLGLLLWDSLAGSSARDREDQGSAPRPQSALRLAPDGVGARVIWSF